METLQHMISTRTNPGGLVLHLIALAPESVVTLCGMLREVVGKRRIAAWRAEMRELETQWGDVWRAQGLAA